MKNSNKTNGENLSSFKFWAMRFAKGYEPYDRFEKWFLKALQAKDLQCQQEKIELVEGCPMNKVLDQLYDNGPPYSEGFNDHADLVRCWKQNYLKRLKS